MPPTCCEQIGDAVVYDGRLVRLFTVCEVE